MLLDAYSCVFFWDFKRMDNVNYNFEIINLLSICASMQPEPKYLYKPIYILISAIIECTLYDHLCRIYERRKEHFPNLDEEDIAGIRQGNFPSRLSKIIKKIRRHAVFGSDTDAICLEIDKISIIRNRVHIQNESMTIPLDEKYIWTSENLKACGSLLKKIYIKLCIDYPRPDRAIPELTDFPEPWATL